MHPNSLANLRRSAGPGRPKLDYDVRALARKYTLPAIKAIAEALQSTQPAIRLRAAEVLLDRGYGKPVQAVSGPDGSTPWVPFTLMLGEVAPEVVSVIPPPTNGHAIGHANGDGGGGT